MTQKPPKFKTPAELIEILQRLPSDAKIVAGYPLHDYLWRVVATEVIINETMYMEPLDNSLHEYQDEDDSYIEVTVIR